MFSNEDHEGIIEDFTGMNYLYGKPPNHEIILEIYKEAEEESTQKIMQYLEDKGFLN